MVLEIKRFEELSVGELYEILKARSAVFVVEQSCVYQDLDDKDKGAYHLWLRDEEGLKAYLRVLSPGVSYKEASIGRVISLQRRRGLGGRLMKAAIALCKDTLKAEAVRISAQQYACPFYESVGFERVSDVYDEDGIPHVQMLLKLA